MVPIPMHAVYAAEIFASELMQETRLLVQLHPHANFLLVYSLDSGSPGSDKMVVIVHGAIFAAAMHTEPSRMAQIIGASSTGSGYLLGSAVDQYPSVVVTAPARDLLLSSAPIPFVDPSAKITRCAEHLDVNITDTATAASAARQADGDIAWVVAHIEALRRYRTESLLADGKTIKPAQPFYIVDEFSQCSQRVSNGVAFRPDELAYYLGFLRRMTEAALYLLDVHDKGLSAPRDQQRIESYMLEANLNDPAERELDYKARLLYSFQCSRLSMKARSRALANQQRIASGGVADSSAEEASSLEVSVRYLLRALAWLFDVRHRYLFRSEMENFALAMYNGSPLDAVTPISTDSIKDRLEALVIRAITTETFEMKDKKKVHLFKPSIALRTARKSAINDTELWLATELTKTRSKNTNRGKIQSMDEFSETDNLEHVLAQDLADDFNTVIRYEEAKRKIVAIYEPIEVTRRRLFEASARAEEEGLTSDSDGPEYLRRVASPIVDTCRHNEPNLFQVLAGDSELPTIFYMVMNSEVLAENPRILDVIAACLERFIHIPGEFKAYGSSLSGVREDYKRASENNEKAPEPKFVVLFYELLYGELKAANFVQVRSDCGITYLFLPTLVMANLKCVRSVATIFSRVLRVIFTSTALFDFLPAGFDSTTGAKLLPVLDHLSPLGKESAGVSVYERGYVFRLPPDVGFEVHPTLAELQEIFPSISRRTAARLNSYHDIYAAPISKGLRDLWDDLELSRFMLSNHRTNHALPTRIVTVPLRELEHSPLCSRGACVYSGIPGCGAMSGSVAGPCSTCEKSRAQHVPGEPRKDIYMGINYREFSQWQFALSLLPARRLIASLDKHSGALVASVAGSESLDEAMQPLGLIWKEFTSTTDSLLALHKRLKEAGTSKSRDHAMHSNAMRLKLLTGGAEMSYTDEIKDLIKRWIGSDPDRFYGHFKGPGTIHQSNGRTELRWGTRGSFAVSLDEYHTGRKNAQGREIIHPPGSWIDYESNSERGDVYSFVLRDVINGDQKKNFIDAVKFCHLWVLKTYGQDALSREPDMKAKRDTSEELRATQARRRNISSARADAMMLDPEEYQRREARGKWQVAHRLTNEETSRAALGVRYLRDIRGIADEHVLFENDAFRFMPIFELQDQGIGGSRANYHALVVATSDPLESKFGDDHSKRVVASLQAIPLNPATSNKVENLVFAKRNTNSSGKTAAMIQPPRAPDVVEAAVKEFGACIALAEGPETSASIAQACPELEVWCTLGISRFTIFPYIGHLRGQGEHGAGLLICADLDLDERGLPQKKKEDTIASAVANLTERGYKVIVCKPQHIAREGGKDTDFNDVHRFVKPLARANEMIRKALKTGRVYPAKVKVVPKAESEEEEELPPQEAPKGVKREKALDAIRKRMKGISVSSDTKVADAVVVKKEEDAEEEAPAASSGDKHDVSAEEPSAPRKPLKQARFEDSEKTRKFMTKVNGSKKVKTKKEESPSEEEVAKKDESSSSAAEPNAKSSSSGEEEQEAKSAKKSDSESEKANGNDCNSEEREAERKSALSKLKKRLKRPRPEENGDAAEDIDLPAEDVDKALARPAEAVKQSKVLEDD